MLNCKLAIEAVLNPPRLQAAPGSSLVVRENDRLVANIPAKTTYDALAAQLNPMGGTIAYPKAGGRFAATGDQITVTALGGAATFALAVLGDLNGDGRADALDAQLLRLWLADKWEPPYSAAAFLAAADSNGDGAIDEADADAMFAKGME